MFITSLKSFIILFNINLVHSISVERPKSLRNCGLTGKCINNTLLERYLNPSLMDKIIFDQYVCYCDDDSHVYEDSCIDSAKWPPNENIKIKGIWKKHWSCININEKLSVYGISDCNDSILSNLCSRQVNNDEYHYTLDVPVFSNDTYIVYLNIYCAICHKDVDNLIDLPVEITCSSNKTTTNDLIKARYIKGKRIWHLFNSKEQCKLTVDLIDVKSSGIRKCIPSISACSVNKSLSNQCRAYSMLVRDSTTNKVYKNPHCALCSGVKLKSLICWRGLASRYLAPSLAIIMNFNWNFKSCSLPTSIWDAINDRCEEVTCLANSKCVNNDTAMCLFSNDNLLELRVQGYLTVSCLTISIICLMLHNIVFYSLPNQQNLPGKILKSLSWSLIIAQLLFILGVTPVIEITHEFCVAIVVIIHFFYLSAFFWMNCMSIDIWRTFSNLSVHKVNTSKQILKYSIYSWLTPAFIVAISLVIDQTNILPAQYRPFYAGYPGICWFANRIGLGLFLYLPICILLIVNIILFGLTVCWFQKRSHASSTSFKLTSGRKEVRRLYLYIKLSTIMGLSWIFGMVAAITNEPDFWYLFIVFNGLQGAFIFLMFDLKSHIVSQICDKFGVKSIWTGNNSTNNRNRFSDQNNTNQTNLSRSSRNNSLQITPRS